MAVPTLALIPAAQGSKFYSVLPSNGVGDFDFTRASTATRINSKGLIEEVASGVSRLDYTGGGCPHHLLEPQSTNLFPYSEDFENSAWDKNAGTTITNNYAISPDGTQNASRYLGTGTSGLADKFTLSATDYTISFWVKSNNGVNQFCRLIGDSSQNSGNLLVTTEWTKLSYTFTASGLANKSNGIFRDSSNNNIDILIWGAQLEQGSYASSYIPNFGTALGVTRLAETANNAGDASTFNDSEGMLFAELSGLANGSFRYITLSDGTDSNNVQFGFFPLPKQVQFEVSSGGSSQLSYLDTNIDVLFNTKLLIKYKQNDFSIYVNGFEVHTDSSGLSPIGLDRICFDRGDGCGDNFYGKTKKLEYYNTTLTSLEMETLTSYTSFNEMALNFNYTI